LVRGRSYVIPDDAKALVLPIYGHRIRFAQHARLADDDIVQVLADIAAKTPVPVLPSAVAN